MSKPTPPSITQTVMSEIRNGRVHMKPRTYFWILSIVSSLGVLLTGLVATYLCSILFFWVRIETARGMAWGARAKLSDTLATFPWWALLLSPLFVTATIVLLKKHGHLYRIRNTTLFALVALLTITLGALISYTSIWRQHRSNQPAPAWRHTHQVRDVNQ